MTYTYLAATEEASSGLPLNINFESYIIQILSFIIVFLVIKKYAVGPIVRLLEKRRQTIDDGVKMGLKLEEERELLNKDIKQLMRDARHEADSIINNAEKEAREILRGAEKSAQRKSETMFNDAEARIKEEVEQSRRKLENEIVELVAEATEVIVGEKVDTKKDGELIKKVLRNRKK